MQTEQLLSQALAGQFSADASHGIAEALKALGISISQYDHQQEFCFTIKLNSQGDHSDTEDAVLDLKTKTWQRASPLSSHSSIFKRGERGNEWHEEDPEVLLQPDSCQSEGDRQSQSDWTTRLPDTDHIRLLKAQNWAATSLGPMSQWSECLRTMTHMMLADPHPAGLYWGPERVHLHNERFVDSIDTRHHLPLAASGTASTMSEAWTVIAILMDESERTGRPFHHVTVPVTATGVPFGRNTEDPCFDETWMPVRNRDDKVEGFCYSCYELTRRSVEGASADPSLTATVKTPISLHTAVMHTRPKTQAIRESIESTTASAASSKAIADAEPIADEDDEVSDEPLVTVLDVSKAIRSLVAKARAGAPLPSKMLQEALDGIVEHAKLIAQCVAEPGCGDNDSVTTWRSRKRSKFSRVGS